ncbi:MAG: oligosaccharide flippase family protein [Halioglobus sp.]|nr:oligosaccharide flippase family protein [Halioglobus sp.]
MYLLSMPVGLLTSILLARNLGPAAFGQYAFVLSLLALLALPVAGGLPQLLTREVAKFSHDGKWALYRGAVRAAHGWVLLMAALVLIGFWLAGPVGGLIPQTGKWALLGIVVLLVPLQGLNAVRNGTIKGLGFPALAELPTQAIQPILLLASVAALAALDILTAANALWAQVGVAILAFVVASVLFYRIRPKSARGHIPQSDNRNWLFALLPLTLVGLVGTLNAQVATVLLGTLGTDEAVAGLRVAERGAQLVLLSLTLVNMVISPHIVKSYHDNDLQRIQKLSRRSARGAISIGAPIGLVLLVFGKPLIGVVFGEEYIQMAYLPMMALVCGYLFHLLAGSSAILLIMCGYEKLTLFCQLTGLVVMVALSLILIPLFQALGAALAVTVGIVVYTVLQALSVTQCLKIRPGIF